MYNYGRAWLTSVAAPGSLLAIIILSLPPHLICFNLFGCNPDVERTNRIDNINLYMLTDALVFFLGLYSSIN